MSLVRLLPAAAQNKLQGRPGLHNIIDNLGWLFFDKVLRLAGGLLVGIWVARYLGPDHFGLLNYAIAFAGLFAAIAALGLNSIVVRDLVKEPDQAKGTLGTAFALQVAGGLIALALMIFAINAVRPDDALVRWMVAIFGACLVIKATDVIRYWFESHVESRYAVWVDNAGFILVTGCRVVLILNNAPLIAFAWIALAEAMVVAAGLLWIYSVKGGAPLCWRIDPNRAKQLLLDGWPLVLSGLAITIYMRIDQIMLGQIVGDQAVGVFSVAIRLSEVWYFIPMAIAGTVFPSVIQSKEVSETLYIERSQKLFQLMVFLAVAIAAPISLLAEPITRLLYGSQYAGASTVLAIHIWAGVFVFLGVATTRWFLIEGLQKLIFFRTLSGALLNVALNYLLIPLYGPVGAAVATVFSQAMACMFFNALTQRTRPIFFMQCKAFLFPRALISQASQLIRRAQKS